MNQYPIAVFMSTDQPNVDQLREALAPGKTVGIWEVLTAIALIVSAVVLGRLLRIGFKKLLNRSRDDDLLGSLVGRVANYGVVTLGIVYALDTLGVTIGPILGALGIFGIALAFAFQDILQNFVAGIILQVQRPFNGGDEVSVLGYEGKVMSVDARTVTLTTPSGEVVHLPSAEVLKSPIVNLSTHGRRRTTVEVGVSYETDLEKAREIILRAICSIKKVYADPAPQVLGHTFGSSSIDFSVRFWHDASIAEFWLVRDQVVGKIKSDLDAEGIEIPFLQQVLHVAEGNSANPEIKLS